MSDTTDLPHPPDTGDRADRDVPVGEGPPPAEAVFWEKPISNREARALAGGRRRRRWPAVLASFALFAVLGLGAAAFYVARQIDPPGDPGPEVEITIPSGTGTADIADLLAENGIISSARIFSAYVQFKGSGSWQAGVYTVRENSAFDDVIGVLEAGPAAIPFEQVTIPEGYAVFANAGLPAPGTVVQRIVDPENGIPRFRQDRVMELLLGGTIRSRFQPPGVANLEGLLFPDTYRVEEDEGPAALLTAMVERFDEIAGEAGFDDATARISEATGGAVNLTPYQAVIVASLIEREAQVPDERPMMARVIYNRLADGSALGIDASLNYALGHPATLESELATDTPYNLREVAGLPPTPIAVPGRASLEAAIAPAPGEWRYYVLADESGRHTFTNTYDEFLAAKAECQRLGLC